MEKPLLQREAESWDSAGSSLTVPKRAWKKAGEGVYMKAYESLYKVMIGQKSMSLNGRKQVYIQNYEETFGVRDAPYSPLRDETLSNLVKWNVSLENWN